MCWTRPWRHFGPKGTKRPRSKTWWRVWGSIAVACTLPSGTSRRLFLRVLDRYRKVVVRKLLDILDTNASGKAAIRQFFATVIEHVMTGGPLRGCLVTNSAVERGLSDPDTAKKVSLCVKQLEDGFYKTLLRDQSAGELDNHRDLRALARYLTCNLQGLLVIGKIRSDRSALEEVVEVTLRALK